MNTLLKTSLLAALFAGVISAPSYADSSNTRKVFDESSLQAAIHEANNDNRISRIVFQQGAHIYTSEPVQYSGSQPLILVGRNAVIDGVSSGSFTLDDNLTATTTDGTLMFNTAANITIRDLSVVNSATRGIVVNIPDNATGDDIEIKLRNVNITDSMLFGLHIDDNSDEFDDGISGSDIGIDLTITHSNFVGNGTGAIDFDGVRVDERGEGDITALIRNTKIDGNGGDGIELDEAGNGDVDATMMHTTINDNGFYNAEDLDDGFDIDEANGGSIYVKLVNVESNNNMDEGLDFDESGDGNVHMLARSVESLNNVDEGIKIDEEDAGDVYTKMKRVESSYNGDDGIQITEIGEGSTESILHSVTALENAKFGVKVGQWVIEDESSPMEEAGFILSRNVTLIGNSKGDEISTNNVVIKQAFNVLLSNKKPS